MAGRLSPAVARAQPLRPALRLPLLRRPSGRTVGLAVAGLAFAALVYLAARETPLFAVRTVTVTGAPARVEADVAKALRETDGTSLVKVDAGAIAERLRGLPSVFDARVDRAFPHTLRVTIRPEVPLALVRERGEAWLVSARGRVIRASSPREHRMLPRIWLASEATLESGELLAEGTSPLRALAAVPAAFPARIATARRDDAGLTFVLAHGIELRLGAPDDLTVKLTSAAAVLRSLGRSARSDLAYLDVSLPERPVAKEKSQAASEG